ncbi:MAG: 50S ribosomal protein L6 [Bacteriovoracaceae bacterium]|jgi:large subunit ribosomal protein L6|nr:50S ribosomal protein L6 [Bacteriovoracaceae bacterium]
MSRIGKVPVALPDKVEVKIEGHKVVVKGPKGTMEREFNTLVTLKLDGKNLTVTPADESVEARSQWGTARTLLNNMVTGVSKGFVKSLEFTGVGYKAGVSGSVLNLSLGYSHPIDYKLPVGVTAKVDKNRIDIEGCDKEIVGQVAAVVRSFREPEPYKGKGLKYSDETIIRKAGKAGGKGK